MKGIFRLLTMPVLVAGGYTLLSILWILFSDRWVAWFAQDDIELMLRMQTWKGLFFVVASGILLALVLVGWNAYRARLMRQLTESEDRYRRMVEASPDAVVVHRDARIVYANQAARELYGLGDDYVGLSVFEFIHPDDAERLRARAQHLVHGGTPLEAAEYRHVTRDGREVEVEVTAALADFDGEPAVHAYVRDLSARKRAERTAERLEKMFEAFARNSPAGLAICRRDRRLLYSSPAWRMLMGAGLPQLPEKELLQRGPSVWQERSEDGRDILVWVFFLDEDERTYGLIALDVTERMQAERRLAELNREREADNARLQREMDAFVYAVSHDLRAPLRSMSGFGKAVLDDHGDKLDESARADLERVHRGAERMSELLDGLLELSRMSGAAMRPVRLQPGAIAEEVADEMRARHPGHDVRVRIGDLPEVEADEAMFRVLLRELFDNAWKFTQGRGDAIIEFVSEPGGVFVVRDNGNGYDMEHAYKLFMPFQHLHAKGESIGHGLGLVRAQKVVSMHGGRIWAEGEPGEGAAFRFTLGREPDR